VIPPGGSGKVVAKVHANNYHGRVSKSVTVTSNDPSNSSVGLTLTFTVKSPVDVFPAPRVSLNGAQGDVISTTLTLRRDDGQPLELKEPLSSRSDVKVSAEQVKPGREDPPGSPNAARAGDWRVTFTLADTTTLRNETSTLKLLTNHPERPELTLRTYISVRAAVEPIPRSVQLQGTRGRPSSTQVQFRHGANRPFQLASVKLAGDLPGVTARISSSRPLSTQRVEILVHGSNLPAGVHQGKLVVETGVKELPHLEVPITLSIVASGPSPGVTPPTPAKSAATKR
jgi:hypothetical protein